MRLKKMTTIYSQYDILKEIGSGGFSRVYKAQSKENDEIVAVKVVGLGEDDDEMKRIVKNEIRVMKAITDMTNFKANFVQFVDELHEPNRICIIMEYLHGGELFDRIIARKQYSENDACAVMKTLIRALDSLHKKGIVHRDLKPENIVYADESETSDIKIMDFGLSWFTDEDDVQESAQYVGTPGYIAPEVLLNSQYGPEGDIWSMGVILYILLSGRMPFAGRTPGIQNAKIMSGTFHMKGSSWDNVSSSAKSLIQRMLTVDPKKRISAKQILKHQWMLEDPIRRATTNLGIAISRLREFNDRRKIQAEVQRVLDNANNQVRERLTKLIEKNNPTGLTLTDLENVRKAFVDKNGGVQDPVITKENFVEVLTKLGFTSLPLEDMFDALITERQRQRDLRANGASKIITQEETEAEASTFEIGETALYLDDVIIGLSTVVALEQRDKLLHYLYETYNNTEGKGGISSGGLAKILRVLASYGDERLGDKKKKVAARITQAFFSREEDDVVSGGITYEEFSKGINTFGEDVFTNYFAVPVMAIAERVEKMSSEYLSETRSRPVRKTLKYFKNAGNYMRKVSGKWSKGKKEREHVHGQPEEPEIDTGV